MESEQLSIWDGFSREEKERESAITGKHRVVIVEAEEAVTGPNSKSWAAVHRYPPYSEE